MHDKVKVISVVVGSLNEWLEKIAKHLHVKDSQNAVRILQTLHPKKKNNDRLIKAERTHEAVKEEVQTRHENWCMKQAGRGFFEADILRIIPSSNSLIKYHIFMPYFPTVAHHSNRTNKLKLAVTNKYSA